MHASRTLLRVEWLALIAARTAVMLRSNASRFRSPSVRRATLDGLAITCYSLIAIGIAPPLGAQLSVAVPSPARAPASTAAPAPAEQRAVDPRVLAALSWRNLGPFRAGRVAAVSGAIGQPGVFYAGYPGGGLWKTTSAGQTWYPVFDAIKSVSSVGSVEVAPSDPNVVYVGTGDMITATTVDQGDGMYRSGDAGRTWQHLGLVTTRHIPSILVDTRDPNTLLIAAQGDPLRKSDVRGVFRSIDGGRTWTKTLYVDDQTGVQKLARATDVPNVVFAATVRHYVGSDYAQEKLRSWQFGLAPRPQPDTGRTGTAIYKSIDGGVTWKEVPGTGLPRLEGKVSVAVAMHTAAQRIFLVTNGGFYRSDDGGTTWVQKAADDERIRNGQGGYSCGVWIDPSNPDIVYTIATAAYRSTDGGNTFTGIKGAPGGDDPQQMWIDPTDGQRMLLGLDQGATVSLDGGATWSSWYNQSTEQLYHIAADNSFPYWVYATQQDAGAIRTRVRGNYGAVTMFDWNSVNGWEWGTILPDPLDPNTVYASGAGIVKISYPSEQWINVSPTVDPAARARTSNSQPLLWAPWDQHQLIAGLNYVVSTVDGGAHWTRLSPELAIPKSLDSAAAATTPGGRGSIESLAASSIGRGVIWVGTTNGLIHLTRDGGKTWTDVSIPDLPVPRRSIISSISASFHEAGTAYVAVEMLRTGDRTPYLYRTRDFGQHWTKIVAGMPTDEPSGSVTRVIRADPKRRGLIFAGTESGVHLSFDDGDHWQSLTLNMPNTNHRDMVIKGNDLLVGTYGRGIWVLDDISLLRQVTATVTDEAAHLFAPGDAVRMRRNVNGDTPLPPEIPHALNPLEGVIIDYWLTAKPVGEIVLDVLDANGKVVRHLTSAAITPVPEAARPPAPDFWIANPAGLPVNTGANRVHWDLRHDAPPAFSHGFEISANPGLTPASPEGPLVPPGVYSLRLTVDGKRYTQSVTVRNDPRSRVTTLAVRAQYALLLGIDAGMRAAWDGHQLATSLHAAVARVAIDDASAITPATVSTPVNAALAAFGARLDQVTGAEGARGTGATPPPTFRAVNGKLASQLTAQDNADYAPTPAMLAAYARACGDLARAIENLRHVIAADLPVLNAALSRAGRSPVAGPAAPTAPRCTAPVAAPVTPQVAPPLRPSR